MIAANTTKTRLPTKAMLLLGALSFVATAGTGCTVKDKPNYLIAPQINHMMFSKAVESQVKTDLFKNGRSLQLPPEGTLPRGHDRVHFPVDMAAAKALGKVDKDGKADLRAVAVAQAVNAGKALKNPVEATPENVARGEEVFGIFCSPCHGKMGLGDGPVASKGIGMFPLSQKNAAAQDYADGHIFHIITYGRGNMGSYATQIAPTDRWKAILWLRKLQKGGAK